MNIKQLDEQVSVSEQVSCDALQQLAQAGVEVLVCNRPEEECEAMPSFAELERAAAEQGVQFVAIPFASGQLRLEQCVQFAELLAGGKKVHAFCRTGNRSCNLWAGARSLSGADKTLLLDSARRAGFDVSAIVAATAAE